MNRKVSTIISCLLILAISATLLLIIILGVDKKDDSDITYNNELTCDVSDIDMLLGDKNYGFFNFNKLNVEVSFELDKDGIININEEFIEALSVGEVIVTIIGKKGNEICQKQFTVKVKEGEYYVKIIPVLNCKFDSLTNVIFMESNSCHFYVEIYNEKNIKLEDVIYNIICDDESVILNHGILDYLLITSEDCKLNVMSENSHKLIEINVVCFK